MSFGWPPTPYSVTYYLNGPLITWGYAVWIFSLISKLFLHSRECRDSNHSLRIHDEVAANPLAEVVRRTPHWKATWKENCKFCRKGIADQILQKESVEPIFYEQLFCQLLYAKKFQTWTVSSEKLRKTLLYKKVLIKCWWNWLQKCIQNCKQW